MHLQHVAKSCRVSTRLFCRPKGTGCIWSGKKAGVYLQFNCLVHIGYQLNQPRGSGQHRTVRCHDMHRSPSANSLSPLCATD